MKPRRKSSSGLIRSVDTLVSVIDIPHGAMIAPRTIPDPYEQGAILQAVASIRDDPIGRLYARGQIDQAQFLAARRWQELYEASEIGPLRGMQLKDPVDGCGETPDPITDKQRKANLSLKAAAAALGVEGEALIKDVLGNRLFMYDIAIKRGEADSDGEPKRSSMEYYGRRLRECLETLAVFFGLAGKLQNGRMA